VIAKAKRAPHMPWQRRAVDCALEVDPLTGHYWYSIVVVSVPRQSGKTKLEGDVADHRCLSRPRARVWITMQNGKTVDSWMREEHFENLKGAGVFRGRYAESRRAGEVGVRWPALGSTFYTFPPKRDALHSKQGDLIYVDEAWAHGAEVGADLRQAIRPTMSTRRGAQLWIVSTMGDDSSVYLDGYIEMAKAALGDPNARVCFIDYGVDEGTDPDDLEAIAARHPAYGYTIDMQALVDAREEFRNTRTKSGLIVDDVAGWMRAYGNLPTRTREAAFAPGVWSATARPRVEIPDRVAIGLDATPSGDWFALGAGWKDAAGDGWLEVLDNGVPDRDTPALVVDVCRRRDSPLYLDRAALGALELVDAIAAEARERRVPLEVRYLNQLEYASACGIVKRGVERQTVHHMNDEDLDANVEVLATRDLGDGGVGWARKGSAGRITEMVATTVALKGFDLLPAPTRRAVARAGRR
jgi:hypothetical protein